MFLFMRLLKREILTGAHDPIKKHDFSFKNLSGPLEILLK